MAEEVLRDKISTSIPVSILELPDSLFNQVHNEFVTHAKLKIFYVGQTGDGRLFTEEFSKKLIKTLPQSPVVGYYDEQSEDFKAHNSKQYVYGYVPETAGIHFEMEGNEKWAITDVILFTGRKDNIGEVASKIIGMQHSLELDPNSVEYVINRDAEGKFKNVEFINGKFIGLSVVGNSEKPAFNGSHFFTIENEDEMIKAFKNFQNDINAFFARHGEKNIDLSDDESKNGGVEMDISTEEKVVEQTETEFVEETVAEEQPVETTETTPEVELEVEPQTEVEPTNFMKTPYDEVQDAVMEQFRKAFGDYAYVVQWSSIEDVIVYWNGMDGKYYRVDFTMNEEDETLSFGEPVLVKPRYLTEDEINTIFTEQQEDQQGGHDGEEVEEQKGLLLSEGEAEQFKKDMAELQTFRKQEKGAIIKEFVGLVDEKSLAEIEAQMDDFTKDELEAKLAVAAMKKIKAEKAGTPGTFSAVRFIGGQEQTNPEEKDPAVKLINQWKDKK